MANKLKKLSINRVDLVDRPSNPLARVVLFKSMYGPKTTDEVLTVDAWWAAYYKILDAFNTSISSILYDSEIADAARVVMLKESVGEAAGHLTALFDAYPTTKSENTEIFAKIEKTVDVLNELDTLIDSEEISTESIEKILGGLEMAKEETNTAVDTLKAQLAERDATITKHAADVDALKAEITALKAQIVEKKATEDAADIWKGVNPAVKAQFEDLKKQADENAKVAKAAEENTATVKMQKRVGDELKGIAGTADEKVALLRSVQKAMGDAEFEKLYAVLRGASEAIVKSELLTEKGRTGASSTGSTAFEKIRAIASEKVAKGTAKTEAEGITQAAVENPALYKEYMQEVAN